MRRTLGDGGHVVLFGPLDMLRQPTGQVMHDIEVDLHGFGHAGTLHLHGYRGAVGQRGAVDLADRGGGQRFFVEAAEQFLDRRAKFGFDPHSHLRPGHRRHVILELG